MRKAQRILNLAPYLFAEMNKKRDEAIARGVKVINLSIGDPDLPTPRHVIERMIKEVQNPLHHRYPDYEGSLTFREAVARWYRRRFNVKLDPKTEIMALIGSKEGIAHIIWAFIDEGDYALVPDPGYPVYKTHVELAGGRPYFMPLTRENGFLPELARIPEEVARKAKLLFLNYPNNPTAGVATLEFFQEAVSFARRYDLVLVHDAAYSEMTYDGYVAPSILEVAGAKDIAVEFNSLSKPFNMTGWRIGMAVGNKEIIDALGKIKTNTDSGQFTAIQMAAVEALENNPDAFIKQMQEVYTRRRDLLVDTLNAIGWAAEKIKGSFYLWVPVPGGGKSGDFAAMVLEKTGIIITPGGSYGPAGEGYVRISLTAPDSEIEEAARRLKETFGR